MPDKPTSRQLNYLRALANRTGQTFTYPTTVAEASREIEQAGPARHAVGQPADRPRDRRRDRLRRRRCHTGAELEVSGHGSSATWAHHREPHPPAATRPMNRRPLPTVGQRTELARYTVAGGERVLYGQRVDGVVRVTDRPAQPGGRSYLVERELERDGNGALDALVVDYLAQAQKLATVPMSVAPLDSWLEAIA